MAMSDERSLRNYLLGKSPAEEQRRIEERLLDDDEYPELLLVIEEEMLDGYVRGEVPEDERESFDNYFLATPARRRKLRMARSLRKYVEDSASRASVVVEEPRVPWWRAVLTPAWRTIVVAALALGGIGLWRIAAVSESLVVKGRASLKAAFPESPIETRIAHFNWAPPNSSRGEAKDPTEVASQEYLDRAHRDLYAAFIDEPGAESTYALGQLLLAEGKLDDAIKRFEQALIGDPNNAKLHSDLGAALLERARVGGGNDAVSKIELLARSLEQLNQARALDSSLLEAQFNRALCYQRMQLPAQAKADWTSYLEHDNTSAWSEIARRNLKIIEDERRERSSQSNDEMLDKFLTAYRAGDVDGASRLVSRNREVIKGSVVTWQLAERYFRFADSGLVTQSSEMLAALRYVGELERSIEPEGDRYTAEIAHVYEIASPANRADLARAHSLINEGNALYIKTQYGAALAAYAAAGRIFRAGGDEPEAGLAGFLAGSCHQRSGESQKSLIIFQQLAATCRERNYLWLLSQSLLALGALEDRLGEPSIALAHTSEGLDIAERLGDIYNAQKGLAQLGALHRKLGDYQGSIRSLDRCLASMNDGWSGTRQMWRNYDQITEALAARRLYDSASDYAEEALRLALDEAHDRADWSMAPVSYMHLAYIRARQQMADEALDLALNSVETSRRLSDDKTRLNSITWASLQVADLYTQKGEYTQALSYYEQAIAPLTPEQNPALLYEARKRRLLCRNAARDDAGVQTDLQVALPMLEKYRNQIAEDTDRSTFFEAQQDVYDAAIDYAHRTGNEQAVFEYAEASRARSLLYLIGGERAATLEKVERELPENAQLVEYAALDDKLLICLVSRNSGLAVTRVNVGLSELTDRVLRFRRSIIRQTDSTQQARELYHLLVEPIKESLASGKELCIVPDKALNHLPFAALMSPSGRYFFQDTLLTVSPSATVYLECTDRAHRAEQKRDEQLLAVANPSFDKATFPFLPDLPSTVEEVERISGYYGSSMAPIRLIGTKAREQDVKRQMKTADVIHLASHYVVVEEHPMKSKLLLAAEDRAGGGGTGSPGYLQADEISGLGPLSARLVVLSACESGVEHYYSGEGMIGMSRVFIAANVPLVVASLWQVQDEATKELIVEFHRLRKERGLSTVEALQQAQSFMLSNKLDSYRQPYHWAAFITIGGHASF
jgi:CHAT domain-containing protein